jgi:hypothetical protein
MSDLEVVTFRPSPEEYANLAGGTAADGAVMDGAHDRLRGLAAEYRG